MGRYWTQEQKEFVIEHYPTHRASGLVNLFNKKFNEQKTVGQMQGAASRLKVTKEAPAGFYTVSEVASICQLYPKTFLETLKKQKVPMRFLGNRWLVTTAIANRLIKRHFHKPNPSWEPVSCVDAAKRLSYHSSKVFWRLIKSGFICSYKFKGRIYIPADYVKAAEAQLKETGNSWVNWKKIHKELGYE